MHWFEPMHCVICGVGVVLRLSPIVDNSCVYFEIPGAVVRQRHPKIVRIGQVSIVYPW